MCVCTRACVHAYARAYMYGVLTKAVSSSDCTVLNDRMIHINNECKSIWKEVVLT